MADPEAPALRKPGLHNSIELWIEIGNPSARKIHKASKTAKQVMVFTYKNPEVLLNEIKDNEVHRADEIQIRSFDAKFLDTLGSKVEKSNRWSLVHQQGHLDVTIADEVFMGEMQFLS